jgi:hypothetical protein
MKLKFGKVIVHALIIGLLVAILVILMNKMSKMSNYEGAPITTVMGPSASSEAKELFDIKPSLNCTPGPSGMADYYTSGLTPGGICGGSQSVKDQLRDFTISDGIGGSLLER